MIELCVKIYLRRREDYDLPPVDAPDLPAPPGADPHPVGEQVIAKESQGRGGQREVQRGLHRLTVHLETKQSLTGLRI